MPKLTNPHPGDVLREDYLAPLGMSAARLAAGLRMCEVDVTEILAGARPITAVTALRLERFFGANARFWLNLQTSYDLEEARRTLEQDKALAAELGSITPSEEHRRALDVSEVSIA